MPWKCCKCSCHTTGLDLLDQARLRIIAIGTPANLKAEFVEVTGRRQGILRLVGSAASSGQQLVAGDTFAARG